MTRHPIQPLTTDEHGTLRFKANKIVNHLLDHGGIDMNKLATFDFPNEDWEQFAQLIGYSLSGAGDLSYFSDDTYEAAETMHQNAKTELGARCKNCEAKIRSLRDDLRGPVAMLYGIHPDDLGNR